MKFPQNPRTLWILFALVGVLLLGYFHRTHVYDYLPYILILLCPLMHVSMNYGHGNHGHENNEPKGGDTHDR